MNTKLQDSKSPRLKNRILLTISLLTIVRIGSFIPVPYITKEVLVNLLSAENSSNNTFAQLLNTFSGGGNSSFGLLSLGILPYINASIIIQLLTTIIPALSKMQKDEGEYGRRKLVDFTRYLTFFWAIVESISISYSLREVIFEWNLQVYFLISLSLITGSMIVLWFSELITKNGLGNGSSLLICFNIVSNLPDQIKFSLISLKNQINNFSNIFLLISIFLITTIGCIYINEAIIKIPLVSARQLLKKTKSEEKNSSNSILPLRINQAGVMPLVFTSYAILFFSSLFEIIKKQTNIFNIFFQYPILNSVISYWFLKILFWIFYATLIFFFTYFYSTIVLDPKDVAERFRKNSVVILGISPGSSTRSYLSKILRFIAKINAIFLIYNIIGLQILESILNLNIINIRGLGFTSQLILVNVLIDTIKRIRSFLNEEENYF
jgi:preprotein translocase subunit SecY|uniref:Protein translocase subunit SecY n=1 Tax=Vaucheria litorea TaxID=109269 RepID=SECY_VAULI|nr:preprotein translocase subunit SecY [Vaucheria litorea]B7T1W7.1 RecName: Full=Protein translocase subunit SecY [Vaucheria litorea]ACF70933.1 preprotein-translocase subunit Y [Vaucheria litorea]